MENPWVLLRLALKSGRIKHLNNLEKNAFVFICSIPFYLHFEVDLIYIQYLKSRLSWSRIKKMFR